MVYDAGKRLHLHAAENEKGLDAQLFALAAKPGAARTILFIEQPEKALDVCERLRAAGPARVALLTGTMRGWERDRLATHDPVF